MDGSLLKRSDISVLSLMVLISVKEGCCFTENDVGKGFFMGPEQSRLRASPR